MWPDRSDGNNRETESLSDGRAGREGGTLLSDWQLCQAAGLMKSLTGSTMACLCLWVWGWVAPGHLPDRHTLRETDRAARGPFVDSPPALSSTVEFPSSSQAGGRGQMVALRLWAELRKESERKGREEGWRGRESERARGREARSGQKRRHASLRCRTNCFHHHHHHKHRGLPGVFEWGKKSQRSQDTKRSPLVSPPSPPQCFANSPVLFPPSCLSLLLWFLLVQSETFS